MERTTFVSHDGKEIALYVWDEVKQPSAVVKIVHGMVEHSGRYDDFARFLNSQGYIVVMNDLRGHGYTAEKDSLGYEEGDMFSNNVGDQLKLIEWAKEKYKLPVVIMGHSYGSFVTQAVMENNPDVKGYILSGSNYIKGPSFTLCGVVARYLCKHKGGRCPAESIVNLSFKQYEKKIPGKSNWLSKNEESVAKYNEDPFCTYICSANFYRSFMAGINKLYKEEYYKNINGEKPVLIVSGQDDPVGNYGKGIKKLQSFYEKKAGVKDLTVNLYQGDRHEVLNELDRDKVYEDIAKWLERVIG